MAMRISISVPEELYNDLDAHKERMNVSKICQDAIRREIDMQKLKNMDDMDSVIERLRSERREHIQWCRDMGAKDGANDAKDLSFDEFQAISKIEECDGDIDALPDSVCDWLNDRLDKLCRIHDTLSTEEYLMGWCECVKAFWEEIKEKL